MRDAYLWDRSGEPDAEVEHFERFAGQFAWQPQRRDAPTLDASRAPTRRLLVPTVVAFATAAAVLLAIGWVRRQLPSAQRPAVTAPAAPPKSTAPRPSHPRSPSPPSPSPPPPPPTRLAEATPPAAVVDTPPVAKVRRRRPKAATAKVTSSVQSVDAAYDEAYKRAVRAALAASQGAMTQCYRAAPKAKTGALVVLSMSVAITGKVTDAKVVRHNIADRDTGDRLAQCLRGVVIGWTLVPRTEAGEDPAVFMKPDMSAAG